MPGYISSETIKAVIERTDLVALIGEYTRLDKRGGDWWGCCPFHAEKTPSFHVVPDRKMYYCFGCHEGGNAIDFVKAMEKVDFPEAVASLAKRSGIEVIYSGGQPDYQSSSEQHQKDLYIDLYTRVAGSYHYCLLSTDAGQYAYNYIKGRGISDEIIKKFQLGYSLPDRRWLKSFLKSKHYSDDFLSGSGLFSKKNPGISFFSDRLMFPIFDRKGQVVAFGGRLLHGDGPKYLNSGDLIQYHKGETLYAFNFARQSIREQKSAVLCEGYMDVLAYHQCGIMNAVAPLGTALTEDQIKVIRPFIDTVYLSFDSDRAGQAATWKAVLLCRKADLTVKIIRLEGGKDPAEIMQNQGAEILTCCIKDAILDSDYLLSVLANEHLINTPEGKTKAALAFFPYIDALNSDIQKESCLVQMAQVFNLNIEAVKRDFTHRDIAQKRIEQYSNQSKDFGKNIKPTAELRAVLAVIANLETFELMRASLTADDFEDSAARDLFIILEECYREDTVVYSSVLAKCGNEYLKNLVAKVVTSGEYAANPRQMVEDSIRRIKRNSLERKRQHVVNRIRRITGNTLDDRKLLDDLLSEKMNIDFELNQKDIH